MKFMSKNQAQLLTRRFIMSQFSYCPLIWMCHSRRINNQINMLDERALRVVYKDKSSSEIFKVKSEAALEIMT